MVWIIIVLIVVAILLYQYLRQLRMPANTVVGFVGTMGAGKTYLAVREAMNAYRKQRKDYVFGKIIPFYTLFVPTAKYKPSFYSNIPVYLGKKWWLFGERRYSEVFTKEHLMRQKLLPEGAVVLLDEIGQMCSQWEFDNPYVREQLADFVRFYRHWIDGRMFVTDQSAENIVKPVRCRLGMIYHLNDFRRWYRFPFFKVNVTPLLMVEDSQQAVTVTADDQSYFFGVLHYRFIGRLFKLGHYNSRCYSPIYELGASRNPEPYDETLKTRYLIDIAVSRSVSRDYKVNRKHYRDALYQPIQKKVDPYPSDDIEYIPDVDDIDIDDL